LRAGALVLLAAALISCSGSVPPAADASPSAAQSLAADLRTQLDLLLGEHVMVLAKATAAAVNHTADYGAYAALLTTNSSDLAALLRRAFGNTAAMQLVKSWNEQNGYLVDYAIGVVTHDDAKAKAAMLTLTGEFVPGFAQQLSDASGIGPGQAGRLLSPQVTADKAFIDEVFAHDYTGFYTDLHRAYAQTSDLGDALALAVVRRFPDKFPGDPTPDEVDRRVTLNLLLQEHAYVSTMATAALIAGRSAETPAASNALMTNRNALAALFGPEFPNVWTARTNELLGYAAGDNAVTTPLTVDFVSNFSTLAHVTDTLVGSQLKATLKVIDDQRSKLSQDVADDDRAAAAAMQPIADSAAIER